MIINTRERWNKISDAEKTYVTSIIEKHDPFEWVRLWLFIQVAHVRLGDETADYVHTLGVTVITKAPTDNVTTMSQVAMWAGLIQEDKEESK